MHTHTHTHTCTNTRTNTRTHASTYNTVLSLSLILPLINTFPMYAVLLFIISVNFAKFDLLLISIHLFSLQMLLFHPNLIIAIVFFTAYLIPPLNVFKEFKIPLPE